MIEPISFVLGALVGAGVAWLLVWRTVRQLRHEYEAHRDAGFIHHTHTS